MYGTLYAGLYYLGLTYGEHALSVPARSGDISPVSGFMHRLHRLHTLSAHQLDIHKTTRSVHGRAKPPDLRFRFTLDSDFHPGRFHARHPARPPADAVGTYRHITGSDVYDGDSARPAGSVMIPDESVRASWCHTRTVLPSRTAVHHPSGVPRAHAGPTAGIAMCQTGVSTW